jgi:hypothetical protein
VAVDLLAPGRVAAELELRGIDNAAELVERHGPPERLMGWIGHYDRQRSRRNVGPGILAAWVRGNGTAPAVAEGPSREAGAFDEHLRWCAKHVPKLSPSLAGGCFDVLRVQLGREPTAAEVRARVAERLADYGPEPA